MDLDWTRRREDGVTFVACRLANGASVPRRARLANRLDAPVLPPRRAGVPEAGWDADGVTVRVGENETRAIGYACPTPPNADDEPPVELADVERAAEKDGSPSSTGVVPDDPTSEAIRRLGGHRPPRAVCDERAAVGAPPSEPGGRGSEPSPSVGGEEASSERVAGTDAPIHDVDPNGRDGVRPAEPAAVEAWLDAVERRVSRAERLDGADVATATEVLAATGGAAAAVNLADRIATDADRLAAVSDRAEALAERAAAAEVPTDALDRIA